MAHQKGSGRPTFVQCRQKYIDSPPCSADSHTGIGNPIISNYNTSDFDDTLGLKKHNTVKEQLLREPQAAGGAISVLPVLMREHIQR